MSIFKTDALAEEHALITGATGGIGYETAKVLASMGADVTITGRKEDVLKQLKEEVEKVVSDATIMYYIADLADESERQDLVKAVEEEQGPISLLVNSAGISDGGVMEDLTQEVLERVMHLNYTVPILLTQEVYESMKKLGKGSIVNISSLSGLRGLHGKSAYAGSKFALNGFTQSFAHEAIEHNIRVNSISPGFVDTAMGRDSIRSKGEQQDHSFEEQFKIESDKLPSGRITTPKDVANTIAFLLSDAAENIIGESVKISGGSVMR